MSRKTAAPLVRVWKTLSLIVLIHWRRQIRERPFGGGWKKTSSSFQGFTWGQIFIVTRPLSQAVEPRLQSDATFIIQRARPDVPNKVAAELNTTFSFLQSLCLVLIFR